MLILEPSKKNTQPPLEASLGTAQITSTVVSYKKLAKLSSSFPNCFNDDNLPTALCAMLRAQPHEFQNRAFPTQRAGTEALALHQTFAATLRIALHQVRLHLVTQLSEAANQSQGAPLVQVPVLLLLQGRSPINALVD